MALRNRVCTPTGFPVLRRSCLSYAESAEFQFMNRFLIPLMAVVCVATTAGSLSAQLVSDGFEVTPAGFRHRANAGFGGSMYGSPMVSGPVYSDPGMGMGMGMPMGGCGCGGFGMCGRCRPSLRERLWSHRIEHMQRRYDRRMNRLCNRCNRFNCGCATPLCAPTCVPTCAPVTTYVPKQCITYQQVPVTCYRTEAYYETVPVTVYQQQLRYRQVPVQSTKLVPQVTTTMVPQTSYVPQAGCSTCGPSGMSSTIMSSPGMMTTPGIPYPAAGLPGGASPEPAVAPSPDPATSMYTPPTYPSNPSFTTPTMGVPTPTADPSLHLSPKLDTTWQTVPSRHDPRLGSRDSYGGNGYRMVAYNDEEAPRPSPSAAGRFSAPTAAGVWQSQVTTGTMFR